MQIYEKELSDTDSIYCAKPTNSHQSSIFIGPTDGPVPCGLFGANYVSDMDVVIELSRDNLLLNVLSHYLGGVKYKKRGTTENWDFNKSWLLEKQASIDKVFAGTTAKFHVSLNKETTRTYLKGIAGVKAEGGTEKLDVRNYLFSGDTLRMGRKDDGTVVIVVADRGGENNLLDSNKECPVKHNVDLLATALECFRVERDKVKAPAGWNTFDEWAKAARVAFDGVDETKATDPNFDYAKFMRRFAISVQVANTKFAGHSVDEKAAVLKFLNEQKLTPQVVSWYLDETHRPKVNGADVPGMGVTATLFFMMEIHPDQYASWSDMTYSSLAKVGLHKGAPTTKLTLSSYDDCKSKQCLVLAKMNEMGIGKAADDSSPADYVTVNEFLWFVNEHYDLIIQQWSKLMKHEIKLTNQKSIAYFEDFIKKFADAAESAGLSYDLNLIKRFVCALLAKPFVVLTGLSGSGKTKLAEAFTKWIAISDTYKIVPVGADWTNNEKLLGFPNALDPNNYIQPDTGVLRLLIDANDNPDVPFFLILDEMNLSHVERYFADFLSAMESSGSIKLYDGKNRTASDGTPIPAMIPFPKNLFVIGTMNVDETTHMFSPKVLDRAQVVEFRVTADQMKNYLAAPKPLKMSEVESKGVEYAEEYLKLRKGEPALATADRTAITDSLNKFFPELAELGSEFAFRTASEAVRFCGFARTAKMELDATIDASIMQKLLPKLHGSRRRLALPLEKFWEFCRKDGKTESVADILKKGATATVDEVAKYPISAEKIKRLYKAAEANGFASYAEA